MDVKIGEVGLILVRREDPINCFVISVTKQYYSMIGFYYTSRVTGKKRVYIVAKDTCGIVSSYQKDTRRPSIRHTLRDLVDDPLVSEIAVRPLAPIRDKEGKIDPVATHERNDFFKVKIAEVRSKNPKKSVEEWLKDLVGYPTNQDKWEPSNIELVNQVIFEVGYWDYFRPESRHRSQGEEIDRNLLRAYLIDNPCLEPIYRLPLPERSPSELSSARERSIRQNKRFLTEIVRTFVQLLIEDPQFYQIITEQIKESALIKDKTEPQDHQEILNLANRGNEISQLVISMIEDGRVDREVLRKKINYYQRQVSSSLGRIGLEPSSPPAICSREQNQLVLVTDSRSSQEPLENIERVGDHLRKIVRRIKKQRTPQINLNLLINHYNQMVKMMDRGEVISPLEEGRSYWSVLLTRSSSSLPVEFEEGTKYIPLDGSTLDKCTRGELEELLRYLDVVSNGEDKYEYLRGKVTDRLARDEMKD